ncbi:fused MFS/spermidine synthase [Blastococcus sp. SYSU D01042]
MAAPAEESAPPATPAARPLAGWVAAVVTFLSSGAVLVLEIVGLRLIAPYVGVTLQTSTAVIGFALAAIALGAWTGGAVADRSDPRRLIAPLMVGGGALVIAVLPLVRFTGSVVGGADAGAVLLLAAVAVVVPAALLSAVPPMVVKLQLSNLDETGAVVGRLSGIGTLGAIAATFVTGFLLIAVLPSSVILVGTGVLTVAVGVALGLLLHRGPGVRGRVPGALVVLAVAGALLAAVAPTPCEEETAYHCARVVADPERDSGRVLMLDTLRHSYVDLEDPTHLEFEYVRAIASVADASFPGDDPVSALHVGGGGLTLPRYLAEVRPGTRGLVLEVDPGVVALDREQLGLETSADLRVRVADGRVGLAEEPAGERDLVVGDAFGGLSVPWQLTTREAVRLVDRALAEDGVYAVNLIDHPPLDFVRAELATLREVFAHVVLLARSPVLAGQDGGNVVAVASQSPLDAEAIGAAMADHDLAWRVAGGTDLDAFVGDAEVLTDDHAPVDQLLTPYERP